MLVFSNQIHWKENLCKIQLRFYIQLTSAHCKKENNSIWDEKIKGIFLKMHQLKIDFIVNKSWKHWFLGFLKKGQVQWIYLKFSIWPKKNLSTCLERKNYLSKCENMYFIRYNKCLCIFKDTFERRYLEMIAHYC